MKKDSRARFGLALLVFISALYPGTNASAASGSLHNDLRKSESAVIGVSQFCSNWRAEFNRLGVDQKSLKRLGEELGSISRFGVTSHVYSVERVTSEVSVLIVSYGSRSSEIVGDNCMAAISIRTDAQKLRIRTSRRTKVENSLNNSVRAAFDASIKQCRDLGSLANEVFTLGHYRPLREGGFVKVEGRHDCDVAVPNNSSAVIVSVGNIRFEVVVVFNNLFLLELAQ